MTNVTNFNEILLFIVMHSVEEKLSKKEVTEEVISVRREKKI